MRAGRRALASILVGWCAALLPAGRANWAAAMMAELDTIEDGHDAMSFAVGCVWGSIKERMLTPDYAARSIGFMAMAGMIALALSSAAIASRRIDAGMPEAPVFVLTSALFGAAAVWSHRHGAMTLVRMSRIMIPFYVAGYLLAFARIGPAGTAVDGRLYEALAIEGIVIWSVLLAAGIAMLRIPTSPATRRM